MSRSYRKTLCLVLLHQIVISQEEKLITVDIVTTTKTRFVMKNMTILNHQITKKTPGIGPRMASSIGQRQKPGMVENI